jgi:DNA-binding protein H-NS
VASKQRDLEAELARIQNLYSKTGSASEQAKTKCRLIGQEWSGRGSQPAWVKAVLDAGESPDDLKA